MSMPLLASLNAARTLPFAGQIQSTSSPSVPGVARSGSGGTGVAGALGGAVATMGGGASPAKGDCPDSAAFICDRARSENGTLDTRGSTFTVGVFASGRASIGGPGMASGVVIGVVTDAVAAVGDELVGAARTRPPPTSRRVGVAQLVPPAGLP